MKTIVTTKAKWKYIDTILTTVTGVVVFALSARYQVPLFIVPVTLQSLVVILMAWFYPDRHATSTLIIAYILAACGLPILASPIITSNGLMRIGYLMGFLLATECIVSLKKTKLPIALIFALSQCLILGVGCVVLSQFFGWGNAIKVGVLPFILPELIKNILACAIVYTLQGPATNNQEPLKIYSDN